MHYRKIYEQYYGSIPIDKQGRTYDIHHIDGNHTNNNPQNLIALSIQEHYNVHFKQGDWYACYLISERMNKTPEEISKLASELVGKASRARVKNGTHHFLDSKVQRKIVKKQIEEGKNNFCNSEWQKEKTKKLLEEGRHVNQIVYCCPYCNKIGKGPPMKRWHFDNCREKSYVQY